MPVPALSSDQRKAASARAVDARRTRSEVGRELKAGRLSVVELLARARTDDAVAGMRVSAVLAALPRYGSTRAAEAQARLAISPGRRLRGLGTTQRAGLIALDTWSSPEPSSPGPSAPEPSAPELSAPELSAHEPGRNPTGARS